MADPRMIDKDEFRKLVSETTGDVVQRLLQSTVQSVMRAEAETLCGAGYNERSVERINSLNGSRTRPWDTRTGTIDLQIPKLRHGSYFPHWLLEPRRRTEVALHQVIMEAYVSGISTRSVDDLVKQLGIVGMDKSKVSRIAAELDERVSEFRNRPLSGVRYCYVWIDALYIKVREGGRTVSVAVGVATAVTAEGHREIIALDCFDVEDGASWTAFLRGIKARGLSELQLVVSDCHLGLKAAIAAVFPGASWQRCRAHLARNVQTHVPRSAQDMVSSAIRSIFSQPDAKTVREQFDRVLEQMHTANFTRAARILGDAKEDLLAFTAFPKQHWRQIWSNNPQERLNREIRRRTDVVGIFPNRDSIIRLVGALLAEQHDEWQVSSRRYMRMLPQESVMLDGEPPKELAAATE